MSTVLLMESLLSWGSQNGKDAFRLRALVEKLQPFLEAPETESRVDAWLALTQWIRVAEPTQGFWADPDILREVETVKRLSVCLEGLEALSDMRTAFQHAFEEILLHTQSTNLFATAGLPSDHGLFPELWDRMMNHLLPAPRDDHELERLLRRQFSRNEHVAQFQALPAELFQRLAQVLFPEHDALAVTPFRQSFADAFRLLAIRVEAHGLRRQLRDRSRIQPVTESSFYQLPRLSEALVDAWLAQRSTADVATAWVQNVQDCREALQVVLDRLETEGVSIHIVYSMEVVRLCLTRMEHMKEVMTACTSVGQSAAIHVLFGELVTGTRQDQSVRHLLNTSTQLLHQKIVERSGLTGQHYIAKNRKGYRLLLLAAAGGGFITTFTCAMKLQLAHIHFALFIGGLCNGLNYAISFLIIQAAGFVLATKQPAMTAAVLADILRENRGQKRYEEMARFSASICNSQIAAACGNILVVTMGAYLWDFLWRLATGHSFLNPDQATHVFHSLSPLDSGTIYFAALTGVILWLASLIGGWFDNWSVYHRLPQSIRDHPLRRLLGRERLARWADAVTHNMAGWGTNISLGLMLGLVPAFGSFFGFPMEVRHVTLSTGQLALACASLQQDWFHDGWVLRGALGIATMFVLNLGVSFALSLFTAARAYQLSSQEVGLLLREIARHFRSNPRAFLLPPRE